MSEITSCPYCHREIKAKSKFCKFCGSTLKICPKCENLNQERSIFCVSCGENIENVEAPIKSKSQTPTNKIGQQETDISSQRSQEQVIRDKDGNKLIVWPPLQKQTSYQPFGIQKEIVKPKFEPKKVIHPYNKVKPLGFLGGPLPTSNIISPTIEAFAYALALIAVGIVIMGLGLTFFGTLILPIIGLVWGGIILLAAPFYGIYYVSSNWLYKTFRIKRTVSVSTNLWNYVLGVVLFSFIGLILVPIYAMGTGIGITLAVLASVVYLMVLTILPLKAFLADLTFVKAAINERDAAKNEQEGLDKNSDEEGEHWEFEGKEETIELSKLEEKVKKKTKQET